MLAITNILDEDNEINDTKISTLHSHYECYEISLKQRCIR